MAEGRGAERLERRWVPWAVLGGLLAAHLVLGALVFDPKPFIGGDNAAYMILAESLETGQGYRNIHLPGSPRHAQYPPVYPVILTVARAFGGGLITFKVISLLLTTASLVFIYLLARGRLGTIGGLSVTAPFAFNPVLLYYSHWVLSEAPFVLLTLVALWASDRMLGSRRWLLIVVIAALLAYLTRAAGLPMMGAVLLALAWRRRWRDCAIAGGGAALAVGGWWLWGRVAATESAEVYSNNFLLVDPYQPELGLVGPADLIARLVNNVRLYTIEVLPESLAGAAPAGGVSLPALLVGLVIVALVLIALLRNIRKVQAVELFTVLYLALIFLWPQVWTDRRFLLPLLPVLLVHAAAGLVWCFDFLRVRRPVWALPAAAVLLVLLTVPDNVRAIRFTQRCQTFYRQGDRLACYPPPWRAFVQAAEWVKANTPADAIVISRKPRLFYYFGQRRGDVYPFTSDDDAMFTFLDDIGADYVVVAPLSATTYRYLVPVINNHLDAFPIVHQVGEGSSAAYVLAYRGRSGAPGAEER